MEGVCFSADRSHISFLRTVNIAQRGTFKFCLLSLINSHLEQNTRPWREPGPLTCGPATGHISKYEGKCVGQVRGACAHISSGPGWKQETSRGIHTSPFGRHHLLNTEVLQRNPLLLPASPAPLDHHLRPHSLNSYKPHEGGGAFDRRDPTDSAVYLKSDQSANKKK